MTVRATGSKLTIDYTKDISHVNISSSLTSGYDSDIITMAKRLKATYNNAYDDEFYLEYAAGICRIMSNKSSMKSLNQRVAQLPFSDPEWAQYTYEEILQMESNGVLIPDEVLKWAHGMQESDVTSYIVVSSSSQSLDDLYSDIESGDEGRNILQNKLRQNVIKSENAEKEQSNRLEEFNSAVQKAVLLKQQKQSDFKDPTGQLKELTKEWKILSEKLKNGTISDIEKARYEELSTILNTKNGAQANQINADTDELDNLLNSMDALGTIVQKNSSLIRETTDVGINTANIESNFPVENIAHPNSAILSKNSGLIYDLLFGMNQNSIQSAAMSISTNLQSQTDTASLTLSSEQTSQLQDFSIDYTQSAQELKDFTISTSSQNPQVSSNKQVLTPTQSQSSQTVQNPQTGEQTTSEEEQTSQQEVVLEEVQESKSKNAKFIVVPATGDPVLTALATATAAASNADLLNKMKKADDTRETISRNLDKTAKSVEKYIENNKKIENKHNENLSLTQQYNFELDYIQSQRAAEQQKIVNQRRKSGKESDEPLTTSYDSAAEGLAASISGISNDDEIMIAQAQVQSDRNKALIAQNQKTNTSFSEQNEDLKDRNKNAKVVASNTLSCGGVTTAMGGFNMALGISYMNMALLIMPLFPAAGAAMMALAVKQILYATMQLLVGPAASVTGGFALANTFDADKEIDENSTVAQTVQNSSRQQIKDIDKANKVIDRWEKIEIPDISVVRQNYAGRDYEPDINLDDAVGTSKITVVRFEDITDASAPYGKNTGAYYNERTLPTARPQKNSQVMSFASSGAKQAANSSSNLSQASAQAQAPVITASSQIKELNTSDNIFKKEKDILSQMRSIDAQSDSVQKLQTSSVDILQNNLNQMTNLKESFDKLASDVDNLTDTSTQTTQLKDKFSKDKPEVNNLVLKAQERLRKFRLMSVNSLEQDRNDLTNGVMTSAQISQSVSNNTTIVSAASVGANTEITRTASSDDKIDRKLTRFNNDGVIESKKKQRRVNAISASAGRLS